MKIIKLFEAFSQEQYKKAFSHIKSLLDKDTPKEDIVKFIDAFTGDVAKDLDNLRLIIERTQREFNASDEEKRIQFEELNDFDMDNEYEEVGKIVNLVKAEIQNLISSI